MNTTCAAPLLTILLATTQVLPVLADGETGSPDATRWKISGELEEACSCRPACPCWFKSLPSRMTCDGAQAVFLNKGRYGKTRLDGLAVAMFVQSPENKSMFESFGNWNFEKLYVDERASEEQRQALQEIAKHLFPAGAKTRQVEFVSITRQIEGPEHLVKVGEKGAFSGHLLEGGFAGTPKIVNVPLADPTHREFLQGQTTTMTYSDAGQGWNYKDSNYMFNRFKVDSREYTRYEADMARKMAQLGKPAEK